MTEEEAKTKWCPMVRSNGSNATPLHTTGNPVLTWTRTQGSNCIGSSCMMWRASMTEYPNGKDDEGVPTGDCGLKNR